MAKKYNCPNCNTVFASSQSLWNHKQRCGKHCSYIVERDSEKNLPKTIGGAFPFVDEMPERKFAEMNFPFLGEEEKSNEELGRSIDKVIERLNCDI